MSPLSCHRQGPGLPSHCIYPHMYIYCVTLYILYTSNKLHSDTLYLLAENIRLVEKESQIINVWFCVCISWRKLGKRGVSFIVYVWQ